MQRGRRTLVIGLLLGSMSLAARGYRRGPPAGVFTVVSVDTHGQTVSLKAEDGSVISAYVSSEIYDISTLKAGDKVRVDFLTPDDTNPKLSAASIWPLKKLPPPGP